MSRIPNHIYVGVEIEIYETVTGEYVDTTAAVSISDIRETLGSVFQIDIEAGKFMKIR